MILIIDFNIVLEELILVRNLRIGKAHYSEKVISLAGGAGVRTARALSNLGERVIVTGLVGGKLGQSVKLLLFKEGIPFNFIDVKGDIQNNKIIVDIEDGSETLIQGAEPTYSYRDLHQFKNLFKTLSSGIKVICFTGRIPRGFPLNTFRDLISAHRGRKTLYVIYSGAPEVQATIAVKPFLSVIAQSQLELMNGGSITSREAIIETVRERLNPGPGFVSVLESSGDVTLISDSSACYAKLPALEGAFKIIGGSEAYLAGIILGQLSSGDILTGHRFGMAAKSTTRENLLIAEVKKDAVNDTAGTLELFPC